MKTFFNSLKISFVIIGTILGAGFISGKEIYEFFYGQNILIVTPILFIFFSSVLYFSLRFDLNERCRLYALSKPIFIIGNFIIGSGMLSAVDCLFILLFPWSGKYQIFSFLTAVFSSVVMLGGKKWLKIVNFVLVPIMIFVIIFFVFIPYSDNRHDGDVNLYKIASYGGLNLLLAMPITCNLGEGESRKVSAIAALFSSLVISLLIYMIFSCVKNSDSLSDLPVLQILNKNRVVYVIYVFVLFIGILTTLLGAHFTVFSYFDDSKRGILLKIFLTIFMFAFSKIGFQNIVGKVYPAMGIIDFIIIIIYVFERFFFPKGRPKDTLNPLKSTK